MINFDDFFIRHTTYVSVVVYMYDLNRQYIGFESNRYLYKDIFSNYKNVSYVRLCILNTTNSIYTELTTDVIGKDISFKNVFCNYTLP